MISIAAAMGGNVRVGLEDSLYDGRQLAKSNADQVRRIPSVLDGLSLDVATPTEAREMLALKGGDRVAMAVRVVSHWPPQLICDFPVAIADY